MSVKKTTAAGPSPGAKQNDTHSTLRDIRRRLQYHLAMGIKEYPRNADVERFLSQPGPDKTTTGKRRGQQPQGRPASQGSKDMGGSESALAVLAEEIQSCTLCPVADKRQGTVSGLGKPGIRLMIVGDWSRQEDLFSSEVIFGPAEDAMLWKMMAAIELTADQVFVTNCLKCCPEKGTEPDVEATTTCFSYLEREIAAARPLLICAMGELAARILLGTAAPLVRLRGRIGSYRYQSSEPVAVMPTFHPRFLLQNPEMKKATWHDLQLIKRYLQEKAG